MIYLSDLLQCKYQYCIYFAINWQFSLGFTSLFSILLDLCLRFVVSLFASYIPPVLFVCSFHSFISIVLFIRSSRSFFVLLTHSSCTIISCRSDQINRNRFFSFDYGRFLLSNFFSHHWNESRWFKEKKTHQQIVNQTH